MRPPLSLYPKAPGTRDPSALERLGARGLKAMQVGAGLAYTLLGAVATLFTPGKDAAAVCRRITMRQVFFTGFEALPLVSVIALFVGATVAVQTRLVSGSLNTDLEGQILVAVVLRELAPLVTAIIVAGRSGTAIATELGNMKVNSEVLALSSLGIDPLRFVVLPRMIATTVSVLVLTIYFGVLAIVGGHATRLLLDPGGTGFISAGFQEALQPGDLALFAAKGLGLGTLVGWLCCHFGLEAQGSPTEVPQKASHAVVVTLLACVVYNASVTIVFYALAGPPVR